MLELLNPPIPKRSFGGSRGFEGVLGKNDDGVFGVTLLCYQEYNGY